MLAHLNLRDMTFLSEGQFLLVIPCREIISSKQILDKNSSSAGH